MKQYLTLLQQVLDEGIETADRTGIWTKKIFWAQMKYNLADGFPLVTTKKTFLRAIFVEMIWLIRWATNIKYLVDRNVRIWNERPFQKYIDDNKLTNEFPRYSDVWKEKMDRFVEQIKTDESFASQRGDLWPVYGKQRRDFWGQGVDQLAIAIDQIRNNPNSRRIIVNARNPAQLDEMLLPPCHMFYQWNVDTTNNILNLQMYQRSADMFLWVPFNIASYSLLLILVAKITGLTPGIFTHTLWDAHIYMNHLDAVNTQLSRQPHPLPKIEILKNIQSLEDLEDLEREDIQLHDYICHPRIKASVAV